MNLIEIALYLVGGLGLFSFGLYQVTVNLPSISSHYVQISLMNIAGNRMVPWFAGIRIALAVFSPAATVVMIKSYVQSGILKMKQGTPVILGALAAEGIIVWILLLESQPGLSYFLLGIGFLLYFLSPSQRVIKWASLIFGFGLILEGIGLAQEALFMMRLFDFGATFLNDLFVGATWWNRFAISLVGLGIALVVRSNLIVIALAGLLVSSGIFEDFAAYSLIIGTLPALPISSFMSSKKLHFEARRSIMFVFILSLMTFVLGHATVTELAALIAKVSDYFISGFFGVTVFSMFLFLTCSLIGLLGLKSLFQLSEAIVPTPEEKEFYSMKVLGRLDNVPASLAVQQAELEVNKLFAMVQTILEQTAGYIFKTEDAKKLESQVSKYEDITDAVDEEINDYLTKISELRLSYDESKLLHRCVRVSFELESIADACTNLMGQVKSKRMSEGSPNVEALVQYQGQFSAVASYFESLFAAILSRSTEDLENLDRQRELLRNKSGDFKRHLEGLESSDGTSEVLFFDELRLVTDRIASHSRNILEAHLN